MPTYAQQKAWAEKAGLRSFSIYLPAEDLRRLDELADARGPDGKRMGRREAIGKLLDGDGDGGAEELIRIQEETIALQKSIISTQDDAIATLTAERDLAKRDFQSLLDEVRQLKQLLDPSRRPA